MPTDHLDLSDLSESQQSEMRMLALSMSSSTLPATTQQRVISERLDAYRATSVAPPLTSDLAARADQARLDDTRSRHLHFYKRDVAAGRARKPKVADPRRQPAPEKPTPPPAPRARYALDCIDCDETIELHRPTPRVPICDPCKVKRATKGKRRTEAVA